MKQPSYRNKLSMPPGSTFGSDFWHTHDKNGNRKAAYKKPAAERKKTPRHD